MFLCERLCLYALVKTRLYERVDMTVSFLIGGLRPGYEVVMSVCQHGDDLMWGKEIEILGVKKCPEISLALYFLLKIGGCIFSHI